MASLFPQVVLKVLVLLFCLCSVLLFIGCGAGAPDYTGSPRPTPRPVPTRAAPSASPAPVATLKPTVDPSKTPPPSKNRNHSKLNGIDFNLDTEHRVSGRYDLSVAINSAPIGRLSSERSNYELIGGVTRSEESAQ